MALLRALNAIIAIRFGGVEELYGVSELSDATADTPRVMSSAAEKFRLIARFRSQNTEMGTKAQSAKRASTSLKSGVTKRTKLVEQKSESESEQSSASADSSSEDDLDEVESEDELDALDDAEGTNITENESDDVSRASDDEEDNSSSNGDEDKSTGEADPNKKTSKEQHAEQRKLLAERKMHRKSGAEVQQIKSLWEKLRVKKPTPPKEVRERLTNEIWNLAQDIVLDLVMKHDASRVVQTLVKYSSKERREAIVKSLQGNYYQLATSSYGKYLLVKLLHYGSKDSRALIVNELHGKLRKLMRHKEGAYVVEDLYVLYSTNEQKQQMIREFWGSEYAVFKESGKGKTVLDVVGELAEKRQLITSNLIGTITAAVDKGSTGFQILHAAMKDYTSILVSDLEKYDSDIRTFIDLLAEQVAELVHTQEGCEVAASLIALANAKERKVIIKALKTHALELVKNEYGNIVLITLFMTVDDTVLLHKAFTSEILASESIASLLGDKFGRRPFIYLVKGLDGRYFAPNVQKDLKKYEALAYQKTSKKPQEQRRTELSEKAIPLLYTTILDTVESGSFESILSSNMAAQTTTEIILASTDNDEVNTTLRPKLIDAIFGACVEGEILEDYHLINKVPFISRSLKALIQGNEFKWNNEQKKLVSNKSAAKIPGVGPELASRIVEYVLNKNSIVDWCNGQGAFVLVSCYEVLQHSKESLFKNLKTALKKVKKQLAAERDNKGAQLFVKLIN